MQDSDHPSSALIGSNDDLLTEILLCLPVTSILRFKSVSKHWRWLLNARHFTLRFDNLLKSPGLFVDNAYVPFDVENRSPPPFRSLEFYPDPHGIKILQSCNGLLLCCSDRCNGGDRKYYVFNPTTKQFAIIPSLPAGETNVVHYMGLAFHQTECVPYKVVCILYIPDTRSYQIQIYSSDTRTWKISIESFPWHWLILRNAVYSNGSIHSHYSDRIHIYFKVDVEQLLYSNIDVERLPMPLLENYIGRPPLYFGESRGHLHLVEPLFPDNRLHLNVYEMLSDYSGWFVKYRVELDELPAAFPDETYWSGVISWSEHRFYVSDVVRGEKEEDTFMILSIPGKVIRYNVHDKSFEQIFDSDNELHEGSPQAFRYTECLASL